MLGMSGQQEEPRSLELKRAVERARSRMSVDTDTVKTAYKRWAPVYDHTFGRVASEGRKHAVEMINTRQGRVLEVGVGTGLSLPDYGRHLEIVGVYLSPEMLEKAHERVATENLTNVTGLYEMRSEERRVGKECA